jgi:spermidine/putrescine transport system substrate-binding protein
VSGTLRTFTYDDTVDPKLMKPFEAQNPDLDVETATFDSDDEAAAKIRGGFSTDVIEVCLDEAKPLTDAGLLAPIDTSKITSWNDLDPTFRDAPGVSVDGNVIMVPLDAGPQGIIFDKATLPNGVDSYQTLFDPQYAGKVALDSSWLTAFAETALAMGITDPMHMSDDQVEQVKQKLLGSLGQLRAFARGDSDMANLFKSGEVIVSDGGRGRGRLRRAGAAGGRPAAAGEGERHRDGHRRQCGDPTGPTAGCWSVHQSSRCVLADVARSERLVFILP